MYKAFYVLLYNINNLWRLVEYTIKQNTCVCMILNMLNTLKAISGKNSKVIANWQPNKSYKLINENLHHCVSPIIPELPRVCICCSLFVEL